jgi:hypothetical protein
MANLTTLRGLGRGMATALAEDWTPPPLLVADPAGKQRTRIWDIGLSLHCSIIGTYLTATELRRFFVKLGEVDAKTATDHALHGRGVVWCTDAVVAAADGIG